MDKVFSLQLFGDSQELAEASSCNPQKFPWGEAVWLTEPDERTMSRVTAGLHIADFDFSMFPSIIYTAIGKFALLAIPLS